MADLPLVVNDVNELPKPLHARALSSFVLASIGLLTASTVDMIVAFSTSYWATWNRPNSSEHGGYGLWKVWVCTQSEADEGKALVRRMFSGSVQMCTVKPADLSFPGELSMSLKHIQLFCTCYVRPVNIVWIFNATAWHLTTQVFCVLTLTGFILAEVLLLAFMFISGCRRNRRLMSAVIGSCYSAGAYHFTSQLITYNY